MATKPQFIDAGASEGVPQAYIDLLSMYSDEGRGESVPAASARARQESVARQQVCLVDHLIIMIQYIIQEEDKNPQAALIGPAPLLADMSLLDLYNLGPQSALYSSNSNSEVCFTFNFCLFS